MSETSDKPRKPTPAISSIDAFLPPEMAAKAETVGVNKAAMEPRKTFVLAILAGAFIAMGAIFATTATAGAAGHLAYGLTRVLGGLVFSLGLILVVVAGAELFTGNNLIVMAWAGGRVTMKKLLFNWTIVYTGNFLGSITTAALVFIAGQHTFGGGLVGLNMLEIAEAKTGLGFGQAIALGMLCNALVCMAIWLCLSARTTTDKILAILFPITAFVAAGYEHSIANMFFIPVGLFVKAWASAEFWSTIGSSPMAYVNLTWDNFLLVNLLPVTIGNIIGGSLMVGLVYWFVYVRSGVMDKE